MMIIFRLIVALLFIPILASAQEEGIPLPFPGSFKSTSSTEEPAQFLDSLQLVETDGGADIEISGDGALTYSYYSVANPARLIIDFKNVQSHLNCDSIQNPYISAIRCYDLWRSGTAESAVRVVLEFKAHMRFTMTPRTDGLTLRLTAVQQQAPVQTPPPPATQPLSTQQSTTETGRQRQVVENNRSLAEKRVEEQRRRQDEEAQQRRAEQQRTEQAEAENRRAEQERTEQAEAEKRRAEQERTQQAEAEKRRAEQERTQQVQAEKRKAEPPMAEQPKKATEQAKATSQQQQPTTSPSQEPTVPAEPLSKDIPPSKVNSTPPKGKVLLPNGKLDLEPADADPALFFSVPANSSDYVLGPEDVIELKVQQLDELNVTVRIGGDGAVTLPFLNSVQVAGLTAVQASDKIAKLLGEKYLQNPQVSVFAKEFNSQKVSVIGAVTTPGTYPLTGPRTIIQMLAQAGGIRTDAGTNILIFRQDGNGRSTRLSIQRENLLVQGDPAWNILLRAGDVVNIPPQIQISVSLFGAVTTPGVYTLAAGSESTLLKAIARAGGLNRASKSGVKIKRKGAEGKEQIITINLGDILSGKKSDIPLQDGDLVIINQSFF